MRKILVVCPICLKTKRIPIPMEIFDTDEGYLLKFPIRMGVVCEHQFLVLADYNFSIRDYEVPSRSNDLSHYFQKRPNSLDLADFPYF